MSRRRTLPAPKSPRYGRAATAAWAANANVEVGYFVINGGTSRTCNIPGGERRLILELVHPNPGTKSMIDFSAPPGWTTLSTDLGTFTVVNGILSLEDGIAVTLGAALAAAGFTNLGESTVANLHVVQGQFTAVGASNPLLALGSLNVSVWPVDPAAPVTSTFALERSFDGGTTWLAVSTASDPRALIGAFSTAFEEAEPGVLYRLHCSAFAGGAANYRISHA